MRPDPSPPRHLLALVCGSLARAAYAAAALSRMVVTVEVVEQGLHERPVRLRRHLQARLDDVDASSYDAVVLGYGLCGGAISGLRAPQVPLVVPRAHDCITLHLGDRHRYDEEFDGHPGTYWTSRDYLERNRGGDLVTLGVGPDRYEDYVARYGQDNADYLLTALRSWSTDYERVAFVAQGSPGERPFHDDSRRKADELGLAHVAMQGDRRLVRALLSGEWDPDDFLIVPPGAVVVTGSPTDVITSRRDDTA